MFVAVYERTLDIAFTIIIQPNILKLGIEFDLFIQSFLPLNAHDFLNSLPYVENRVVLPKFIAFDLCKVKHVLDDEIHNLSRVLLHFLSVGKLV